MHHLARAFPLARGLNSLTNLVEPFFAPLTSRFNVRIRTLSGDLAMHQTLARSITIAYTVP